MYCKDSSHASNKLSPICNLFVSMKYGEKDEITEEKGACNEISDKWLQVAGDILYELNS